jgi:hypothetical protein
VKDKFMSQNSAFYSPGTIRAGWMRNTFIALIALGLIVRIGLRLFYGELANPELWEFSIIAHNIVNTGVFSFGIPGVPSAFMPPFYPIFIAGIYKLFGAGFLGHFVLSTFLWILEFAIPFVMGWLATRIWNLRVGQFAFLLGLFWPMILLTSGRLLNVPIYTLLPLLSIAVMLSDMDRWKRILLIGLLMGVLWNNRFETPLLMLPLAYYFFFFDRDRVTGQLPSVWVRVFAIASLAVIFTACITPLLVRNAGIYGKPILSTEGGYHFRRGHHDGATGSGRDIWPANRGTFMEKIPEGALKMRERTPESEAASAVYHREKAIEWIKANPDRELQLIGAKLLYFLVADFTHPYARSMLVWPVSLVGLLLGFFYWARTGLRDPAQQVLWMFFGIQLALCVAFVVLPRYRISVEPVPVIFFAAWLASGRLGAWFEKHVAVEQSSAGADK